MKSGPPMLRLRMLIFFKIAWLKASRNQDVYDTCEELYT